MACDVETCLSYKTSKVCHHALAVAVVKDVSAFYALWHNKQKIAGTMDKIASFSLPKDTGAKRHQRTQRRLGTTEKQPQVASLATVEGEILICFRSAELYGKFYREVLNVIMF